MDVLNCFGQRCCVVYTVNGLFDRDVPQTVLFVFVPRHDDGTIVYDVAFLLSKCDLTSGVAQLCD